MRIFILAALFCINICFGQSKYLTRSGTVSFEASMPAFEEVKANNETVTASFNSANGEMAILALVKGFRFKNALMEEHFNENYLESSKFPKAIFKGKIEQFKSQTGIQNATLSGTLQMHGVTNAVSTFATLNLTDNQLIFNGFFKVNASEYGVEIPKIVRNKVSDVVTIQFDFILTKKSD